MSQTTELSPEIHAQGIDIKAAYFSRLDSFRAIAVIMVMLFHAGFYSFQTGWLGVPMFFVLSGFLITRILINNKKSDQYFRAFYSRRVLRIFPIYYLVLFFCLAWGLATKASVSQFGYYFFYLQSFSISSNLQPYFCNTLMGHTWSLSVEELFYLFWPAVIFLISEKNLARLCVLLSVFSLGYKLMQVYAGTEELAFFSLFGNLDALMVGSLLCLYVGSMSHLEFNRMHRTLLLLLLIATSALLALQYFPIDRTSLFLGRVFLSVSAIWLSFFVILFLIAPKSHDHNGNSIFDSSIMKYIGKISYGLYLYHFIIYIFIASFFYHYNIVLDPIVFFLIKISATFLVASVSWHFIEKPLLSLKSAIRY